MSKLSSYVNGKNQILCEATIKKDLIVADDVADDGAKSYYIPIKGINFTACDGINLKYWKRYTPLQQQLD